MEVCEREADRGGVALDEATRALLKDLNKGKISMEISKLQNDLTGAQATLLGLDEAYSFQTTENLCSRFMSDVMVGLKLQSKDDRHEAAGAMISSIQGALKSHVSAMVLEIQGHVMSLCSENQKDAQVYMRNLRDHTENIPYRELAEGLASGSNEKDLMPIKVKLSLDEDLL